MYTRFFSRRGRMNTTGDPPSVAPESSVDVSDSIRFSKVTWVREDSHNYYGVYMMFPKQRFVRLTIVIRVNIFKPLARNVKYYLLLYLRWKIPRKSDAHFTIPRSYLPLGKIKKIHHITRPRVKISGHIYELRPDDLERISRIPFADRICSRSVKQYALKRAIRPKSLSPPSPLLPPLSLSYFS